MTRVAVVVATVLGCGFFPRAPGTVGSLAGVAIAAGLYALGFGRLVLAAILVVVTPIAIWSSSIAARTFGRKDPGQVVIDEVIGQWVTLLGATSWNWKTCLAGFAVFRLLDILKPQPARKAETLPEGLGIVADDVVAGIYGALILYIGCQLRLI